MAQLKSLTVNGKDIMSLCHSGALMSYGRLFRAGDAEQLYASGAILPISDIFPSEKAIGNVTNLGETVLSYESGTFKVNPQGLVGYIELQLIIGGLSGTDCTGISFNETFNNPLPTNCKLLTPKTIIPCNPSKYLTLVSPEYFIDLNTVASDAEAFYLNPTISPYNGGFTISTAGLPCAAIVKVYSKY